MVDSAASRSWYAASYAATTSSSSGLGGAVVNGRVTGGTPVVVVVRAVVVVVVAAVVVELTARTAALVLAARSPAHPVPSTALAASTARGASDGRESDGIWGPYEPTPPSTTVAA